MEGGDARHRHNPALALERRHTLWETGGIGRIQR